MELIREGYRFTCNIGEVDYKCYVYLFNSFYTGWGIRLTVKKYSEKRFWIFKWNSLDFGYERSFELNVNRKYDIKGGTYLDPEYIKEIVDKALWCRKNEMRDRLRKEEFENSVKVITKI
jgi:hypothetical protein